MNIHELDRHRTLYLNADYQPMSYFPLSTKPWADIMFLLVKGWQTGEEIIRPLEYYDDVYVNTQKKRFQLPSVVVSTKYHSLQGMKPAFTKFNVMLRDDFTCQYTGIKYPSNDLTFDHVIPRSKGGTTNWENIVSANQKINEWKADRTPKEAGLTLLKEPVMPSYMELWAKGKKYPPNFLHETWSDYLYWDTEIEQD